MKVNAFGLIEVRGLVTAVEAADAMLKSADVRLIRQQQTNPGLITLIVEGDLAACRAAVDAGTAAAARLGEVVSRLEIGRPDDDIERMVLSLISRSDRDGAASRGETASPAHAPATQPDAAPTPAVAGEPPSEQNGTADPDIPRKAMLAYITSSAKGRNWMEIIRRFPEHAGKKHILEEMVRQGRLRKAGNRYLKPQK